MGTAARRVPIQSIGRALDVLGYLSEQGLAGEPTGLQDVAARLAVPATTAHNIVRTLELCGYVEHGREGGYRLGARCADLLRGARFAGRGQAAAAGAVQALAARTGESVVLATLSRGDRQVLARAEGHEVLRVSPAIDERGVFFERVTGRVLAAFASPAERRSIRQAHGLPGAAWGGIASEEELARALDAIRERGFAKDAPAGQGIVALAAPVLDAQGVLLGALGLYAPEIRAGAERLAELIAELVAAARRLAAELEKE